MVLNPELDHVWVYVESSLACKQEFTNIPLLKQKNPRIFQDRFQLFDYEELPAPEGLDYKALLEKYHLKGNLDEWATKFDGSSEAQPLSPE